MDAQTIAMRVSAEALTEFRNRYAAAFPNTTEAERTCAVIELVYAYAAVMSGALSAIRLKVGREQMEIVHKRVTTLLNKALTS